MADIIGPDGIAIPRNNVFCLPSSPDNYYGRASTMEEISRMPVQPTFYIGQSRDTREYVGISYSLLEDGTYHFFVKRKERGSLSYSDYVLVGTKYTRVNLKNESR